MNILEKWKNLIAKARKLDKKELEALRYGIFVVIVADIFGIWYLLGAKRAAAALLVVLIILLVVILLLERNLPYEKYNNTKKEVKPKMEETTQEEDKKDEYVDLTPKEEKKEEKDEGMFGNMDLGIANAEDYQKRAEEALGTF